MISPPAIFLIIPFLLMSAVVGYAAHPPDLRFVPRVHSLVGDVNRVLQSGTRIPLEPEALLEGVSRIKTGFYSSTHLELGDGMRLYVGPMTTLRVAGGLEPVILEEGELILENRTGQDQGPAARLAVAFGEILVEPDSRVWVWNTSSETHLPPLIKILTDKCNVRFITNDKESVPIPPGTWLYCAKWLPIHRWVKKPADPGESKRILQRLYSVRDKAQAGSLPVSIPTDSVSVNGHRLTSGSRRVLTRADLAHGLIEFSGSFLRDRILPTSPTSDIKVSVDRGNTWERVYELDDSGRFSYSLTPRDAVNYEFLAGVFEGESDLPVEKTPVFEVTYVEQLEVEISGVSLCNQPMPSSMQTVEFYADELDNSSLSLQGTVRVNAPLDRVELGATADGGRFWRTVSIEGTPPGPDSLYHEGTFQVSFAPVPDGEYKFRIRARYASVAEELQEFQLLGTWDAPVVYKYNDFRSTQRVHEIVEKIRNALGSGRSRELLSLTSRHFEQVGRDLIRASGTRITAGDIRKSDSTVQVPISWERASRYGTAGGDATMTFVKEGDYRLLDIIGADPLSSNPPLLLRDGGSASNGEVAGLNGNQVDAGHGLEIPGTEPRVNLLDQRPDP